MATETFSGSDNELRYATDEYGRRRMRTDQEIEIIKMGRQFKDFLAYSTLSNEDKQRLRRISADYVVGSVTLPLKNDDHEDYDEMRRSLLHHVSSDLPLASEGSPFGLCRMLGGANGVTIVADGHPLSMKELEHVYIFIEPSTEVLDRAVKDAAYFYVASTTDEGPIEAEPQTPTPAEYDFDYYEADEKPAFEDRHTLLDELRQLRPFTDQLKQLGGRVISIVGLRPPVEDVPQQKIAS